MPTHNSGIDLSALSPINLTISILTNIASSIVEHHAQNLHGTVLGKALKLAGLIEPNFDDRLKSLLRETLQAFFEAHPGYKYQEIVDFFADAVVTKALADAILESTPINHEALKARLDAYLISLPQARWQLQSARIVGEFLATYRYVRRRHFDDGQVALIDAIEANGAELQQARGLLEKLYAKVEHELSVLQRMKAHFRSVNLDDFPTATPEQVHAFYTGRYPLKWELIKADAIIKRDQEAAVLDSLNSAPTHLEFVCITGQAGDGKSSFAWEIALQTASRLGCWLLQVRSNQTPEAWEMLENAVLETGRRPLVVLVDDVFRDDSFVQALLNMRTDLPIRVIATSRLHEIPDHIRLPDVRTIQLEPPSDHEKQQVLERLRLTRLSKDQRQRLEKASNWLVLMLETTAGESLKTVIRDNVNRLKRLDEAVYHAYEYLCFAGQYDVNVPEDLLLRLDSSGRFYRLYEKPAAAGLIFLETSPRWGNFLRPAHALIAEAALKAYGRNPHVLFETMFAAVDGGKPANRMMLYGIMRNLIEEGAVALLEETLSRHSDHFAAMIEQGRHAEVFGVISKILKALKRLDLLKQAQQHVLQITPNDSGDWEAKFAFIRRNAPHLIPKTLIEAQEWLEVNDDASNARASYLILLKEKGDAEHIAAALDSTNRWLDTHVDDVFVRAAYLNVVKDKGQPDDIAQALDNTRLWLEVHVHNVYVRGVYLNLVKEKGSAAQLAHALDHVHKWLEAHDDDVDVRRTYLNLVKERGSETQIVQTINTMREWLETHDNNAQVRSNYLNLVKEKGDTRQINQALEDTHLWLESHIDDGEVRSNYLNLVKEKGDRWQLNQVLENTRFWLDTRDDDLEVRSSYLNLIKEKGSEEQIAHAIDTTRFWLDTHHDDVEVRRTYLNLVKERGDEAQIAHAIDITRFWLDIHHDDVEVRRTYLNLVKERGDEAQIAHVVDATRLWLDTHPADGEVRRTYLNLVKERGSAEQIAVAVENTRTWLKRQSGRLNPSLLYEFGSLLFRQGAFEEALSVLAEGVDRWKSNIPMRITYAWCLYELGEVEPALEALKQAHWRAKGKMPEMRNLTLRNLGTFYLRQGDHNRAISYLRQSLDVTEDAYKHWVHLEMGKTYLAAGQPRKALDHLRMALAGLDAVNHSETIKTVNELIAQAKGAL